MEIIDTNFESRYKFGNKRKNGIQIMHLLIILIVLIVFQVNIVIHYQQLILIKFSYKGVEKKAVAKLQEDRTVRKICSLDDHVLMAFAGLTADARVLIKQARVECQSHKLTVEDPVTLEYITRHVASLKQRYTQSSGRRPLPLKHLGLVLPSVKF